MSSFNVVNSTRFKKDPGSGPVTSPGNYLKSGTTDFILTSKDDKINKSGTSDFILLSPGTCEDFMLKSGGGTDKILKSGGTDRLLIGGQCTSFLVQSDRRLMKSVG